MSPAFNRSFAVILLAASAICEARAQHAPSAGAAVPVVATSGVPDSMFVPILVYHGVFPHHPGQTEMQIAYDVAPENFEAQMQYLKDHDFHVISYATLVEAIETGKPLAERSVVITLDDGRENQYVHAFPILKKFGYTATFFVYPNPVNRVSDFMTWDQIREMRDAGMTIGSHTYTHPYLTKTTDPKEMKREVETSRTVLEKQLGQKVEFFAYPFGAKNPSIEAYVQHAGYRAARAFPGGVWQSKANLFTMKGLQIGDSMKSFARMIERPVHVAAPASTAPGKGSAPAAARKN